MITHRLEPARRLREASMASKLNRSPSPLTVLPARELRSRLTFSEQALWAELRGNRLGVAFHRQAPIGRYIADFLAPSARLIVEIDGGYHAQRRSADARRDRVLARLGYRVLRLDADLVTRNVASAIKRVVSALGQAE
jgi:very-short-patch-repair endonuclease